MFEALYYADQLRYVNPTGDVGLITLWTDIDETVERLQSEAASVLDATRSRIAVIGNLRGQGLQLMLCNLLFNPQVVHLIAVGKDERDIVPVLRAFIDDGLEDWKLLGEPVKRVKGTSHTLVNAPGFDADILRSRLSLHELDLDADDACSRLERLLVELPRSETRSDPRVRVELPEAIVPDVQPSLTTTHQVVRDRPLDCWLELVVRILRFGDRVELAKGQRLELLNARAVITEPHEDSAEALAEYDFDIAEFHKYQRFILDPSPPKRAYTYGHRLRGYFRLEGTNDTSTYDTLDRAISLLRADPETRDAYISLWDNRADLGTGSNPCLTTLFFRLSGKRLTMTATFRTHNTLLAWLENVYGLMAIQRHVSEGAGLEPGPLTVISHSLTIDPTNTRYATALRIDERWLSDDVRDPATKKRPPREDPQGWFTVGVDYKKQKIWAEHIFQEVVIKRYEGTTAGRIQKQVAADMAVSLISHAMWLGRELARYEAKLTSSAPQGE